MGTRIELSFGATLLVLATACGGGGDTGAVAGLPEYVIDELPPLVVASDRKGECSGGSTDCYYAASDAKPADLSCLRDYTFAKEGDLRTHTIEIGDFFIGDPIPDLCVNVYPDNVVPEEDECGDTFTNASGVVSFEAPENATIAYRVFARDGASTSGSFADTVEVNFRTEGLTEPYLGTALSIATLNLIPTLLQVRRAPGTSVIAATARDCDDDTFLGARMLLYTKDGELVPEGSGADDTIYRYFDSTDLPSAEQPWTHINGLMGAVNVPADEHEYFVEIWGRRAEGEPLERIACELVPVLPNSATLLSLTPERKDGPDCPGKAPEGW